MVFIVKLPARGGAQRDAQETREPGKEGEYVVMTEGMPQPAPSIVQSAAGVHGQEQAPTQVLDVQTPTKTGAGAQAEGPLPRAEFDAPQAGAVPATPTTPPKAQASPQRALDILLAPSVLHHRYVRGVDKSAIVERPERIRAVLLGIAAVYGQWDSGKAPKAETPDDLAAMLSGMDMNVEAPAADLRLLLATRTLPLDASDPALAFVHAHKDEPAQYPTTTDFGGSAEPLGTSHLARLAQLGSMAPHEAPGASVRLPRRAPVGSDGTSSDGEGDERMHPAEIPTALPAGDLYLCGPHASGASDDRDGGSREAICHALGASVEAVDRVVAGAQASVPTLTSLELRPVPSTSLTDAQPPRAVPHLPAKRAFVLSRPPGHHCSGNDPQGFCWVNNVAVAAAHAHAQHGIDRVIVLDIDLHHGNGTQTLAWRINADAVKADADRAARLQALRRQTRSARTAKGDKRPAWEQYLEDEELVGRRALRMCYTSLHDIESFPCEDGDPELVRNASVCVEGAHGQWIWNGKYAPISEENVLTPVHLESHRDDTEFDHLYTTKYSTILDKARRFAAATQAFGERTMIMISCGFDACTYEYPGMQRHGKHVPPAFYGRFASDAARLADEIADGKLISLLEGGYSDRALASGAMAHIGALAGRPHEGGTVPWSLEHLAQLERMAKKVGAAASQAAFTASVSRRRTTSHPAWLVRASEHFAAFQRACGVDARPLESLNEPATPRQGKNLLRGLGNDVDTPTRSVAGGHTLRDRTVMRSRSQHNLADATPARVRARPPMPRRDDDVDSPNTSFETPMQTPARTQVSPTTPRSDPSLLVPGALAVESVPSTPSKDPLEDLHKMSLGR